MCNQETLATLGAQGTWRIQAKQPITTKRTQHGNKGNNKITELRTILQKESQNSSLYKQTKSVKTREMKNICPITYRWLAQVLRKAKLSLSLIRHPTCHSYGKYMLDTNIRGLRVRDRLVVGFKTTYAISVYHHWWCEFDSDQGEVYNIMW